MWGPAGTSQENLSKPFLRLGFNIDNAMLEQARPSNPIQPWWLTRALPNSDDVNALLADAKAMLNAQIAEYTNITVICNQSNLQEQARIALGTNLIRVRALAGRMDKVKALLERDWASLGKTPAEVASATSMVNDLTLWSNNIQMNEYSMVPAEAAIFDHTAKKQQFVRVSLTNRDTAVNEILGAYYKANQ